MGCVFYNYRIPQFKPVTFKVLKHDMASGYHIGQHTFRTKEKILILFILEERSLKYLFE